MEQTTVDLSPWLSLVRELGFAAVSGFLIWCLVKVIWWLLHRNAALSDNLTKVVERNSEALEKLKVTLDARPCLTREEQEKRNGEREREHRD